ncbi:MAG: MucB/RseB C-terminal domain-containing protein [Gammaproteobacteria bacterium]|nr:MucB/RseB C-terminal domain-containing protein [Gammaproteobacteria bacterium]MCP5424365.1 MucB/RseB C-terminal domain-containing protein [Gammaproteobacteria bacterium]MCP5459116.1 MucB/RseB C-terminal domain-containing protein [Gammaproteobacteria bacterium]
MNPRHWYCTLLIAVLWSAAAWAAAEDAQHNEARQWLERMIKATRTLDYEGDFIYLQGEHLEAMHITHSNQADGELQHMISLNGPMREVVVSNNKVTCLSPKQQVIFNGSHYSRSSFPISVPKDLSKLEVFYAFKLMGTDRVAGQDTQIIAIQPRDNLRFGYQLWLDHDTGMVLRSALLDEAGRIVEQMMFTDLRLQPAEMVKQASLASITTAAMLNDANAEVVDTEEQTTPAPWVVEHMPGGFEQIMYNRVPDTPGHQPIDHLVLTDGLVTVSVFVEHLVDAEPLLKGASRMGAMNAFGTTLDDDYQVVAVGEVPPATVQLIASSVKHQPEAVR